MKRRWQERRRKEGKGTEEPNIIMSSNAQVVLEKFARYFEAEGRTLPVSERGQYRLETEFVKEPVDENTTGVFVILRSTYTGHYEPVEEILKILDQYQAGTGWIYPSMFMWPVMGLWCRSHMLALVVRGGTFELPRVVSINASGHKSGLVYAGMGWVVWRGVAYLPKHLVFELYYLRGTEQY